MLGVVIPWALGWWVGALLLPQHSVYVHAFLGAVLTATSVGITARVLKDLGHAQSREARIILGAAVIDDVLGLVVLAVVAAVIAAADSGAALSYGALALVFREGTRYFRFGALSLVSSSRPGSSVLLHGSAEAACSSRRRSSSASRSPGWHRRSGWRRSSAPTPQV